MIQASNTLMSDCIVLVTSIIVGYDIDWARLIAGEIHERDLTRSISIPFPCLIYCLCIAVGMEILHNMDTIRFRGH